MRKLNAVSFGLATGSTGFITYISCILLLFLAGRDLMVRLINVLFHGIDFNNVIRLDISITAGILGLVISFLFWGILGYIAAVIYNKLAGE